MADYLIRNARVITQERLLPLGGAAVSGGRITELFEGPGRPPRPGEVCIDAGGRYLSPGFIDLHVHGGGGGEFMARSPDEVLAACRTHLRHGTTSMAPTTSSADPEAFRQAMAHMTRAFSAMEDGPNILGLHLEGPYFAYEQRGAQDPRYVRDPDPAEYLPILDACPNLLRWSIAPERPGVMEMARCLRQRGVRMSMGHSDALYDEAVQAYEWGFDTVTHLYSCTSSVRRINAYRYAGIVEAAYQLDGMYVEVIADGKHLPASLLRLIYKLKGPDRICLVTDAIGAAGLSGGGTYDSRTCGTTVVVEDGVAKLPDRSAFAGSVATADRLVRTMVELAGVPLTDAVKMMSATPARNAGVFDHKGSLAVGKDADLLLFDDAIHVSLVMVMGEVRWQTSHPAPSDP